MWLNWLCCLALGSCSIMGHSDSMLEMTCTRIWRPKISKFAMHVDLLECVDHQCESWHEDFPFSIGHFFIFLFRGSQISRWNIVYEITWACHFYVAPRLLPAQHAAYQASGRRSQFIFHALQWSWKFMKIQSDFDDSHPGSQQLCPRDPA